MSDKKQKKYIANNKKASHEYFILEKFEAGLSLCGTEVKSIRAGKVNLNDSYAYVKNGEAYIANMHISPYEQGNIFNVDPLRERKLLLNKREISKLREASQEQGQTIIPLNVHLSGSWVKADIAICKGKKLYDKRQTLAQKDAKRSIERAMKYK